VSGVDGTPLTGPGRRPLTAAARGARYAVGRPGLVVGGGICLLLLVAALLAPILAPHPADSGTATNLMATLRPPGPEHPLGTDLVGRDVWSRVLFGVRVSVGTSILVLLAALAIGVPVGLISGATGGWLDDVLMRIVDIFLAFPSLLLALAIGAALGPSLEHAAIAIVIAWWPWYARLMRGEASAIRGRTYIESVRLLGVPSPIVAVRHILPNAAGPVIVQASLDLGGIILTLAALSFLGLGARDPTPEWGLMVEQGRTLFSTHPWVALAPGAAIMFAALAFTLLGEGLRQRLDPKGATRR
jgi:peptide/nickel transport system permease protein